ncbi:MAG: cupin domain-containing protein [Pseudomonadota bacterium]
MKNSLFQPAVLAVALAVFSCGASHGVYAQGAKAIPKPDKMSTSEIAGDIFSRPDTTVSEDGSVLDVTSLMASDGKFASGMYKAGPSREEITEPYGVDEFMYFLEGSVTLTSADGTKMVIGPGEAVTIPKEWTGIWETAGYRKIWVIYSHDGSGL